MGFFEHRGEDIQRGVRLHEPLVDPDKNSHLWDDYFETLQQAFEKAQRKPPHGGLHASRLSLSAIYATRWWLIAC
jgi:hypothetical protein